ncbi:MAG: type I glyceraldehyde-3-phosphate dehydrogenase [Streptosporangiaceae bacterium]
MASIAINSLGRIGRAALKILKQAAGAEVVAVNDLIPPDNLAYLLRYDTVYGRWPTAVTADSDALVLGGRKIPVLAERGPASLPWKALGVDPVLECTDAFRRTPVAEVLDRRFGIRQAIMTTVHACTSSQQLIDGPASDFRHGRAGAANMLPASTGAALATIKALPDLAGKFDGVAIRVPVPAGAIADVAAVTARPVAPEEVNAAFREEASGDRYRGILGVADDPVVSADITGDPRAPVVDAAMTRVVDGTLVKVMSWYDNEWAFSCQMIRETFSAVGLPAPDLCQIRL